MLAVVHLQDNAWMTVARPEIALLALMVSVGPIIAIWLAPALDLVTAAVVSTSSLIFNPASCLALRQRRLSATIMTDRLTSSLE